MGMSGVDISILLVSIVIYHIGGRESFFDRGISWDNFVRASIRCLFILEL